MSALKPCFLGAFTLGGRPLWQQGAGGVQPLPRLPAPAGPEKMGWYHAVPGDLCGDAREELLLYNPWAACVFVYTPAPLDESAYAGYRAEPRQ